MFFHQEESACFAQNMVLSLFFVSSLVTAIHLLKSKNVIKPLAAFKTWRIQNQAWLTTFTETHSGNKRYALWMNDLKNHHPLGMKARLPLLDVISFLSKRVQSFSPESCHLENLEIVSDVSTFSSLIFDVLDSEVSDDNTKNLSDREITEFYTMLFIFIEKFKLHAAYLDGQLQLYSEADIQNTMLITSKVSVDLASLSHVAGDDAQKLGCYVYAMGMKQYVSRDIVDDPNTVVERLLSACSLSNKYACLCDVIATYKKHCKAQISYRSATNFPTNIAWHQGFGEFFYRVASMFSQPNHCVAYSQKR